MIWFFCGGRRGRELERLLFYACFGQYGAKEIGSLSKEWNSRIKWSRFLLYVFLDWARVYIDELSMWMLDVKGYGLVPGYLTLRTQTMVWRASNSLAQRRLLSRFSVKGRASTPSSSKASNQKLTPNTQDSILFFAHSLKWESQFDLFSFQLDCASYLSMLFIALSRRRESVFPC